MCDVVISTGEVTHTSVDFYLPGIIPLHWIRTYGSERSDSGQLGFGWRHNWQMSLIVSADGVTLNHYRDKDILLSFDKKPDPLPLELGSLFAYQAGSSIVVSETDGSELMFFPSPVDADRLLLVKKQDTFGNTVEFHYNSAGHLTSLVDSESRSIEMVRAGMGKIERIYVKKGGASQLLAEYDYDGGDNLVSYRKGSSPPFRYGYDRHLLVSVTNPAGGSLYYQYDSRRRCVKTWFVDGIRYRDLSFDDKRGQVVVNNSRGYRTLYKLNEAKLVEMEVDFYGQTKQEISGANPSLSVSSASSGSLQQVSSYDKSRNCLIVATGEGKTEYQLDEFGNPASVVDANGNKSTYQRDRAGNLLKMIAPDGGMWQFQYTERGRLVSAVDPYGHRTLQKYWPDGSISFEDNLGLLTRRHFDVCGNVTMVEDGKGNTTHYSYDSADNLASIRYPDGSSSVFRYDDNENIIAVTDELGRTTAYVYDLYDSILSIQEPTGDQLTLSWDTEENLAALTDYKGETYDFQYDALDRLVEVHYPDGQIERYEYDQYDNPTAIIEGNGERQVVFLNDEAGRPTVVKWHDGQESRTVYGPHGETAVLAGPGDKLTYEWTAGGEVKKETRADGSSIAYAYDLRGNCTAMVSNSGRRIDYEWDERNRLTKLVDSGQYEYRFDYDASDLVTRIQRPNKLVQVFAYDSCDRMISTLLTRGSEELESRRYAYDPAGRLISVDDRKHGVRQYSYDERDRVIAVRSANKPPEEYSYDPNGNLLRLHDGTPTVIERGNRMIRAGKDRLQYDDGGFITARHTEDGVQKFIHNSLGELSAVINPNGETFSFRYDPLARIMEKKNGSSSTKYSWDGVALLGEVGDESGVADYTFLPGSFLPLGFTKDEKHYAILFDHLGSPFLVCGSTGEALWRPDSLAYGQVRDDSGNNQWDPRLRFQGQYFDRELKVTYNRARYFDQRLGRFVEPDPIGLAGGLNFYLHGPNPINWIDPFGLYQCKIVPKCSWVKNRRLMKEARKKIRAANKRIGKGVNIPKNPPTRCGKTAKSIYEKCQEQNKKMRDLKETSDPCTNEQADHMLEVILTGEEKECKNLHPLNEHVNKSFGSQVKNCASEMRSTGDLKLTKIVLLSPKKQCSEGGAC